MLPFDLYVSHKCQIKINENDEQVTKMSTFFHLLYLNCFDWEVMFSPTVKNYQKCSDQHRNVFS